MFAVTALTGFVAHSCVRIRECVHTRAPKKAARKHFRAPTSWRGTQVYIARIRHNHLNIVQRSRMLRLVGASYLARDRDFMETIDTCLYAMLYFSMSLIFRCQ